MFTRRRDTCTLLPIAADRAALCWSSKDSWWGLDCKMTYTFTVPDAVDLSFEARPILRRVGMGCLHHDV